MARTTLRNKWFWFKSAIAVYREKDFRQITRQPPGAVVINNAQGILRLYSIRTITYDQVFKDIGPKRQVVETEYPINLQSGDTLQVDWPPKVNSGVIIHGHPTVEELEEIFEKFNKTMEFNKIVEDNA